MIKLLTILTAIIANTANAQMSAPYLTQDTRTPEARTGEFILATGTVSQSDAVTIKLPVLEAGYGILSNVAIFGRTHVNMYFKGAQDAKIGGDNMVVGFKWRFLGNQNDGISLGVAPSYSFPGGSTSQEGTLPLAPHDTIGQIPFVITMRGHQGSVLFSMGIEKHTQNPGYQHRIMAGAFAYLITPQFEVMLEYFGRNREDNGDRDSVVSIGARYDLDPKKAIIGSIAQNTAIFTLQEQKYFSYLGIRWRFGEGKTTASAPATAPAPAQSPAPAATPAPTPARPAATPPARPGVAPTNARPAVAPTPARPALSPTSTAPMPTPIPKAPVRKTK